MASSFDPTVPDSSTQLVQRRKRGTATSCNECRRLKLKCSRVFPCSNCVKKGCGQICPEGSLTTGKGNRFVLANTEVLHEKISQLATRVRQLEDALADSHKLSSHQPHPLLSEELLQIKRPLERERNDLPLSQTEKHEPSDTIDAIGSLAISQSGRSNFFGQAANSWYLLQNEEGSEEDEPPDLASSSWLSHAFPFASVGSAGHDLKQYLLQSRPDQGTAERLCCLYYRHAAWMYTPIMEDDFFESIFRPLYDSERESSVDPHSLAVFFMVLALGMLLDLERPAHNPESTELYHLGRAALAIDPIFEHQSIPGIQALLLMCHFMFFNDIEGPRWAAMGLVVKLAQSVGLHRDSSKWSLSEQESFRRQCLMWEIFTYDSWQSLTFARPPSFTLVHIDCKMPDSSLVQQSSTNGDMTFSAWKHAFCSQCLSIVQDQAFGARSPSYKTIQDLDKKVRLFYIPPNLQVPGFGTTKLAADLEPPTTELTMQRYCVFCIREITLFYMHRGFFAHALEESPNDPMGSKYSPSVLAVYNTACSFVGLIDSLFKQHPALTERMWFFFTHVFSCSLVLGSIAQKTQMAISRSALSHLDSAYNLFSRVSDRKRAAKILPILQRLQERAHSVIRSPGSPVPKMPAFPTIKSEVDEFAALSGTTRLVSRRKSGSPSSGSVQGSSPISQPDSPPPSIIPASPDQTGYPAGSVDWQSYPPSQEYSYYSQNSEGSGTLTYRQPVSPMHSLDVIPEYYNYPVQAPPNQPSNGYVSYHAYAQPNGMGDYASPINAGFPDLTATWQNFVAQYK